MTSATTSALLTFSVAPGLALLLFKIDSAASILTTFKQLVLFPNEINFCNITVKHGLVKHLYETGIKHVQPVMQLLGIFPSYSFSQPPCSRFEQRWEILHLRRTKTTRSKHDRLWYVIIKIIIIFIILDGFLPNFYYLKFSCYYCYGPNFYSKCGNYKKLQLQQCRQAVTALFPIN